MGKKKKKKLKVQVEEIARKQADRSDVQTTHGLITQAINLKLENQIAMAMSPKGDIDFDIDLKDVKVGIAWCQHNEVKCPKADEVEQAEELDALEQLRTMQGAVSTMLQ